MSTKSFKNESLDKLIDNQINLDFEKFENPIIDNLKLISVLNASEFVFMDMTDFRMYRTFIDRRMKDDKTENEESCQEVRPVNKTVTVYEPVKEKTYDNSADYHGAYAGIDYVKW